MTAPVNGTDERLDVLIVLFEQLLAELRQANALQSTMLVDVTTHSTGEMKPVAAKKKR